jgi:hypothetical protein
MRLINRLMLLIDRSMQTNTTKSKTKSSEAKRNPEVAKEKRGSHCHSKATTTEPKTIRRDLDQTSPRVGLLLWCKKLFQDWTATWQWSSALRAVRQASVPDVPFRSLLWRLGLFRITFCCTDFWIHGSILVPPEVYVSVNKQAGSPMVRQGDPKSNKVTTTGPKTIARD